MEKDIKKGGRPKKNILEKQQKVVSTKLSSPQFYVVKGRAKEANVSMSEYIRQAVISSKIVPRLSPEEMNLYKQLAGEARNLNQITKLAHAQGVKSIAEKITTLIQLLVFIMKKLSDDWKNNKRNVV